MGRKFDKRLRFIAECINQNLSTATIANEWYIANNGDKLDNLKAIDLFKAWLDTKGE